MVIFVVCCTGFGITLTVFAILDVLKVTKTGAGNLFNAVRIGNYGLGTWLAVAWVKLSSIAEPHSKRDGKEDGHERK
jgi:hypothetical protein